MAEGIFKFPKAIIDNYARGTVAELKFRAVLSML
jgi:predicted RecA/RadA family phage recombinase